LYLERFTGKPLASAPTMRAPHLCLFMSLACLLADVHAEGQQASLADASVLVQVLGKGAPKIRPPVGMEQALPVLAEVRELVAQLATVNGTQVASLVVPTGEDMLLWAIGAIQSLRNESLAAETTAFMLAFSSSFDQLATATQTRIAGFIRDSPDLDTAAVLQMIQDIFTEQISDFNAAFSTLSEKVNASTLYMKPVFSATLKTIQAYVTDVFGLSTATTITCDKLTVRIQNLVSAQSYLQELAIPAVDGILPMLAASLQKLAMLVAPDLGPKVSDLVTGFGNSTIGILGNLSTSFELISDAFEGPADTSFDDFCP